MANSISRCHICRRNAKKAVNGNRELIVAKILSSSVYLLRLLEREEKESIDYSKLKTMARRDELEANSEKQGKSSSSSPLGVLNLKEAEKLLSRASLSGASGGDGSAIKKSCEFKRKLLSLEISSNGISPRGDLYLEEAEKVLSRAGLSGAATDGSDETDKSLKQSEARKRGADLLQKAAIEYCAANLLEEAEPCYDRAAELLNFERIDDTSFTILSNALKFYEVNDQYDQAEQVTLKLIDMATEENDVCSIAKFNSKLANIYEFKQLYGEAAKHYDIAFNLYRVDLHHFDRCFELREKTANMYILQNDFEAAAEEFEMLGEDCHKYDSRRLYDGEIFCQGLALISR
ncbi:MAG: hypothetical protein MHMPM18_001239 [Marteilia pararefringens]